MISQQEHYERRLELAGKFLGQKALIYIKGNDEVERNVDVPFEFRQESNFRYLTGIDIPGVSMMLVPDEGKFFLFAPKQTIDNQVWDGRGLSHEELKEKFLADDVYIPGTEHVIAAMYSPKSIHLLHGKDFRSSFVASMFINNMDEGFLPQQLVDMRMIKGPNEITEIHKALQITAESYNDAIRATRPGANEHLIRAILELHYRSNSATYSFMPIVSMDGNVLHQFRNGAKLEAGRLLLIDSGAEVNGYSADITRTFPVDGKFTPEQAAIYDIVLRAKKSAIGAMMPGVNYKNVHMFAEQIIAEGLRDYGILKGNLNNILESGAHRLFFVHGLGHAMGLDDHDCADYRKLSAGYSDENPQSDKFGLKSLRFARELKPGHVVTVEPGIYFIPALLEDPDKHQEFKEFVDFDKALQLVKPVSGIRIEDDVLVTPEGHTVLGPQIPQEIEDLEGIIGQDKWHI